MASALKSPARVCALSKPARSHLFLTPAPSPRQVICTAPKQTRQNSTTPTKKHPKTAIFFPGQGVQRVGMTTDWLEAFPRTVKPLLEQIDDRLGYSLSRIIADGPNSLLTATENAQPAIMATSIIIMRVLEQEFDFQLRDRVDICLGHSLGEFAALVVGGYLREADALQLVRRRGEVFARCSRDAKEEVGMVALVCEPNHLQPMIDAIHDFLGHDSEGSKSDSHADTDRPAVPEVLIANVNSKNQIVLSGYIRRITELLTHLRQFAGHDPRAVRLKSDSPFHSPMMQPAADLMARMLSQESPTAPGEDIIMWPGRMPCVSNVSARPFKSKEQLKELLTRQAVQTVQWHESIVYLHQEERVQRWLGLGPGKVGRNLVGKEVGMKGAVKGGGVWAISDPREVENVLRDLDLTESYEEEE
ncbi:FabD/lysophospholipase-like protein [Dissoconium aciculare CBS 342.82]|uniref:[acyl-carrier-protein] S-malonyltransferase n=1 Tax=Dissoconium aciculare CBS 342.82 TaxID=1314786 RepID=A0A6J3MAN4_9PEZI|nr:FabD/lysophospholipase-like protein [Dissoconium aciculare CBS 342.82]KAF1824689.1 FabD/lysophospholipase-like protein [Dissoconium aciculare CBS 342.82]